MTVWEAINQRKSIRSYADKPVPDDALKRILEAGVLAPSARNRQSWKFIAVTDPALRSKMQAACGGQDSMGSAPASLVVCALDELTMACGQSAATIDCAVALSFMMLEAAELGLGTCWLGNFSGEAVKVLLGLPEHYTVVAVTPLGYPAEAGRPRTRKAFGEVVCLNGPDPAQI